MAGNIPAFSQMVGDNLPALLIGVPIVAAPLIVLVRKSWFGYWLGFVSALFCLGVALSLTATAIDTGPISYHMGGWAPPLGIEYRIDAANGFVLVIVSAIASLAIPYARHSIAKEIIPAKVPFFWATLMLCFGGLLGVTITADAFNVFVFLEISSLSTYVLVALGADRDKRALTAALDYLVMGTVGATFFVIGIGFLYMSTGTLNMADMAQRIAAMPDNRTVQAGFALIFVGMGLKAAIYPLHLWLPGAYGYAPSAVSTFLAATATKVAIYVMLRFSFSIFTPEFDFEKHTLTYVFMPLAIIAMFAGSISAWLQSDLKRLLAFSSVAQIGYMFLGIALLSMTGLSAAIIHLFNHAITKAALFMVAGIFVYNLNSSRIADLSGMGRAMPWTAAAFVVGGLSLIGVPGTAGFVSKWVLIEAALEANLWPVAILVVLSSLLAIGYIWKVVEVLYFRPAPQECNLGTIPAGMVLGMMVMVLACIYFGMNASLTLYGAEEAATALMGSGLE